MHLENTPHTHEEERFIQTEIHGKVKVMACVLSCVDRLFFFVNYCLNYKQRELKYCCKPYYSI